MRALSLPTAGVVARVRQLARAVREGDERTVETLVLRLARSRRYLAPLAFVVGGFAMLFTGLKLLVTNWRLMLVQALPAMWIWLAMFDLKLHVLKGKSFHVLRGPVLIPPVLMVVAITSASFYLNAVFGFAIVQRGAPAIRPAFARARAHRRVILGWGAAVGLLLAFATLIVTRWGRPWFGLCLSAVVGVMMVCYVAVPSRLLGVKPASSRRDKLTAGAVGGTLGAVICTPPYLLGRVGILMLGSHVLFIPGILLIVLASALQAGATGAVKAVKMSAKLLAPSVQEAATAPPAPAAQTAAAPPPPAAQAAGDSSNPGDDHAESGVSLGP